LGKYRRGVRGRSKTFGQHASAWRSREKALQGERSQSLVGEGGQLPTRTSAAGHVVQKGSNREQRSVRQPGGKGACRETGTMLQPFPHKKSRKQIPADRGKGTHIGRGKVGGGRRPGRRTYTSFEKEVHSVDSGAPAIGPGPLKIQKEAYRRSCM